MYFAVGYQRLPFAVKSDEVDNAAAIWILNPVEWNRAALQHLSYDKGVLSVKDDVLKGYAPNSKDTLMNNVPLALWGTHNSQRIVAQRGTFTIFGKSVSPMEQLLETHPFPQSALTKVRLPYGARLELRKAMFSMGFTDSMVFPSLDGLGTEISRIFQFED